MPCDYNCIASVRTLGEASETGTFLYPEPALAALAEPALAALAEPALAALAEPALAALAEPALAALAEPALAALARGILQRETGRMRRSKIEVYLHYVWATKGREPLLTPEIETAVYRCIQDEAKNMKCTVLALNGLPDHVHLLVRATATMPTLSEFMKRIKGVSSALVNAKPGYTALFRWQEGYGVHAVCASYKQTALEYVRNQKQ